MYITPNNVFNNKYVSTVSCGKRACTKCIAKNADLVIPKIKKHAPLKNIGKALLLLFALNIGVAQCSSGKKVSGDTYVNSEHITYTDAKPKNKDIIVSTIADFRKNLNESNDFLKDVQISLVDELENADTTVHYYDYFKDNCCKNTKGVSLYSDNMLSKQILIQEKAHKEDKLMNFIKTGHYTNEHTLKQTLMHEVGHQFDSYFGHNHNAKFAQKWDTLQTKYITGGLNPKTNIKDKDSQKTEVLYYMNNGLSDKQVFQDAVLKDLQHVAELKKTDDKKLAWNIRYYTTGINLLKEITPRIVDLADLCRSEVYANLFSYAVGENDGDKDRFTENFSNSYEIVKGDIAKYLGADMVK